MVLTFSRVTDGEDIGLAKSGSTNTLENVAVVQLPILRALYFVL